MAERKRQIYFREGQAEENGFMLWIYPPKDKRIKKDFFKTPNYAVKYNRKFSPIDWIGTGVILVIYLYALNLIVDPSDVVMGVLFYVVILISLFYTPSFVYFFRNKRIREWHACEHKTANLIDSSDDINMTNLKKASRIRKKCGTLKPCPITFLFIYFFAVYCLFRICVSLLSIENSSLYWLIFGIMALEFQRLYPLFVIKIFSPLAQHFITTAKPSEDKLKQALKVAKEIEEIVN